MNATTTAYFVATEDSPGELAENLPGRRGYRRDSGRGTKVAFLFVHFLNATK